MRSAPKQNKARKSSPTPKTANLEAVERLDTVVEEGDLITFAATGEQLRVAKVENGTITFEKSTA